MGASAQQRAAGTPAVAVEEVTKQFALPRESVHTLKERVLHPRRGTDHDRFTALAGVSLDVGRGEFVGIVGRNGSGKSTLLKCLAGIYRVDGGRIWVDGRIAAFIELGVGFNPDLTARDNVLLNGVMLGLTVREARARYERVIRFAELEAFQSVKLKNYSSGMQVRLGFSIMTEVEADVLLIDEVLAVGDAGFQQKCFDEFHEFRRRGKTVVLVTHDMGAVERFCDRAILLEEGRVVAEGEPRDVAARYLDLNFSHDEAPPEDAPEEERAPDPVEDDEPRGDGGATILDAWFENEDGRRTDVLHNRRPMTFRALVEFHDEVENPAAAVILENERGVPVFASASDTAQPVSGVFGPGDRAVLALELANTFAPGRLFASPWVVREGGLRVLDRRPRMTSAVVVGMRRTGGLIDPPHEISLVEA